MKKILLIFIMPMLIISGCANQQLIIDAESSQVVFMEEQNALTVSVLIKNKSKIQSSSFQLKIEIQDEKLRDSLKTEALLIGADEQAARENNKVNGHLYKVKRNESIEDGATFNVDGDINDDELEKLINDKNSIKAILLDEKGEVLTSEFIHHFKKINVD